MEEHFSANLLNNGGKVITVSLSLVFYGLLDLEYN